jgi:hypothetical protein
MIIIIQLIYKYYIDTIINNIINKNNIYILVL